METRIANIRTQILTPFNDVGKGILKNTKGDLGVWAIAITLSLMSLLAVYSSTYSLAYKKMSGQTEYYLLKQGLFLVVGLALMYIAHLIHYKWYAYVARYMFYLSIPLLLYTLLFGATINNGSRWISVLGITIQSSDVAKIALFMYLSLQLSRRQEYIKEWKRGYRHLIIPIVIICALILPANFSTAALLGASALLLLFMGRVKGKHLAITVGIAVIPLVFLITLAVLTKDNRSPALREKINGVARLGTWVSRVQHHFFSDANEVPYQVEQSNMAIAKGGFFGRGPGNSDLKNFLPNPFSDFIYSIIIEEYGLLGAFVILSLYMVLLFRCIRIFKKCNYAFGGFLVLGLSFMLIIQACANMAVAVNLFPVTGVSLPLVSMGGTSLFFTSIAFGIILSVSRYMDVRQEDALEEELA